MAGSTGIKWLDVSEGAEKYWKVAGSTGKWLDVLGNNWKYWKVTGSAGKWLEALESGWKRLKNERCSKSPSSSHLPIHPAT